MNKITHEQARCVVRMFDYTEQVGILQDYIIQQEKKDELLERLQLGFDDAVGNIVILTTKLEKVDRLNKLYKEQLTYCDCKYLFDDNNFKLLNEKIKSLETELKGERK